MFQGLRSGEVVTILKYRAFVEEVDMIGNGVATVGKSH